ncbi:hypothetical protein FOG18_07950 [Legionella israelensis]|uniref:hypothetical protein n=1 Tax=Legionella israelensis TaxID=454 RepID=UPI00117DB638|nr:hypothetical protein [Legionella israelensis]QDP72491.1 hypothetical protein FOG18_07950 [Legionella israelensis]
MKRQRNMLEKGIYAGGYELHFFVDSDFEPLTKENSAHHAKIISRNALRILMMGWRDDWRQLSSWRLFHAVFISRDREFLIGMRQAFQEGFDYLYQQLKQARLNRQQYRQVQLYLSNCLSLLPYSDITPYESFRIPQWVNGSWQKIEYKVVPIELTPRYGWKTIAIQEQDRVFAYGLEPIFNTQAESHLIFMGTTYPAGQGFWTQINTDVQAFHTAGFSLYQSGRKRIFNWLQKQKEKIHVCGISLGGALALQLAIDKGEYISRVDALNPPGLYPYGAPAYDHWDLMDSKPLVIVQQQADDPVSRFGIWKKDWLFIKVIPPKDKKGPNGFVDHPLNYAGFAETEFKLYDVEEENIKNKHRNLWLYSLGRAAVYYGLMIPFRYVLRPAAYYAYSHKKMTSVLSGILLLGGGLSVLCLFTGGPLAFAFALSLTLIFFSATLSFSCVNTKKNNQNSFLAKIHDPKLSRIKERDLYSHTVEEQFSYQDLHSYYYVMRCLLKNKPFIPEEEVFSSQFKGSSKKKILEKSQKPEYAAKSIVLQMTKAKYHYMKSTLRFITKFGINLHDEAKDELKKDYCAYQAGKH